MQGLVLQGAMERNEIAGQGNDHPEGQGVIEPHECCQRPIGQNNEDNRGPFNSCGLCRGDFSWCLHVRQLFGFVALFKPQGISPPHDSIFSHV